MPSNQGNYHNSSSNNSITQLSSPLSAVHTSAQTLSPTTPITITEISQQCQPKSRLLINYKTHDDDFDKNVSREINLHPVKESQEATTTQQHQISSNAGTTENQFENLYQNHENGMITIVTVNNLSGGNGNSVV